MLNSIESYKELFNLSHTQSIGLSTMLSGYPVVLSGKGGAGKTYLMNCFKKIHSKCVTVTPTGISAMNAEGETIASVFRTPFGVIDPEIDYRAQLSSKLSKLFSKGRATCLHIDEWGMVRADVLDFISHCMTRIRGLDRNKPFGGIQVILSGSVTQLQPILKYKEKSKYFGIYKSVFAFGSEAFQSVDWKYIMLEGSNRTSDNRFVKILDSIEANDHNCVTALDWLNRRCVNRAIPDGTTYLVSTHDAANIINKTMLDSLTTKSKTFKVKLKGKMDLKDIPVNDSITVKVGMKVLIKVNDPDKDYKQYFNGDMGVITYIDNSGVEVLLDRNGESVFVDIYQWDKKESFWDEKTDSVGQKSVGSATGLPVLWGQAICVHACQGVSLDSAVIDLDQNWVPDSIVYVALSRLTSLQGLYFANPIYPYMVKVNEEALQFHYHTIKMSKLHMYGEE